jgi:hypothetical protein
MKSFLVLLWIGVCVSVGFGALILVGGMTSAKGAPQEAVVCALALCFAVLPYVFTRAVEGIAMGGANTAQSAKLQSSPSQTEVNTSPLPLQTKQQYDSNKIERRKDEDTITTLKL